MLNYIIHRLLVMVPVLFLISIATFIIIQLPPGDYLTTYIANLQMIGEDVSLQTIAQLREQYGLDQPLYVQYLMWVGGMLHGDFGNSFVYNKPVSSLIWERIGLTMAIAIGSMLLTWVIAIPIGIYSAVRQYGTFDYAITFLGFIGMATPGFLFALVLMFLANRYFGISIGGLFSDQYAAAPWSWGKVGDLLLHLWVPVLVLAVASTGGMVRILRANLLDQLEMPYVATARAKGLSEWRLLLRYPVRIAINPIISGVGSILPALISGSVIISIVMNLPTTGPLLLSSLMDQDMYLAGSFLMILAVLSMLGTLLSDLLLAWIDPRIRFEGKS